LMGVHGRFTISLMFFQHLSRSASSSATTAPKVSPWARVIDIS
jgi:hypothetical protein